MNEKLDNLDHLNMSEEELFSPADRDSMESVRMPISEVKEYIEKALEF